jgi:hypothetical protein
MASVTSRPARKSKSQAGVLSPPTISLPLFHPCTCLIHTPEHENVGSYSLSYSFADFNLPRQVLGALSLYLAGL